MKKNIFSKILKLKLLQPTSCTSSPAWSQENTRLEKSIRIDFKNETRTNLIKKWEESSEYECFYNLELVEKAQLITGKTDKKTPGLVTEITISPAPSFTSNTDHLGQFILPPPDKQIIHESPRTMKKQIYHLIGILLLAACSTDKIDTFDSKQEYLFFHNSYKDSLSYSFFHYPDSSSLTIPLEVCLIGNPTNVDREFSLAVLQEESTAAPEHYYIPDKFTLRANHVSDTVHIRINNREDLKNKEVKLTIQIKPSVHFQPGQSENTRNIIRFSNIITRPNWWNEDITNNYLGKYSEKKFKEFIKITKTSNLTDLQPDEIWYLARTFKYYLASQEKAGNPIIDEDQNNMTVTVIG